MTTILNAEAMQRALARMAHEILERNEDPSKLAFIGMQTRGVFLARRLAGQVSQAARRPVPTGSLDISMHRDDLGLRGAAPQVKATDIPFPVDGQTIVLVDDVLFTGRSVRAALDALMDLGRPRRIQLAVLVDRGHWELPIRADYVGKLAPTALDELIKVKMTEEDGVDEVSIIKHRP
jgi:pyrimidine operon attenuation protein/uracil phosphoribosyltransferase